MSKSDGGPAFPQNKDSWLATANGALPPMGASLRDYFAAAALMGNLEQGIEDDMAGSSPDRDAWWHPARKLAKRAYQIADAMLAERNK